eukprot:4601228-Amphidinium_carterae.1
MWTLYNNLQAKVQKWYKGRICDFGCGNWLHRKLHLQNLGWKLLSFVFIECGCVQVFVRFGSRDMGLIQLRASTCDSQACHDILLSSSFFIMKTSERLP